MESSLQIVQTKILSVFRSQIYHFLRLPDGRLRASTARTSRFRVAGERQET